MELECYVVLKNCSVVVRILLGSLRQELLLF